MSIVVTLSKAAEDCMRDYARLLHLPSVEVAANEYMSAKGVVDWSRVDWSLTSVEIARITGYTLTRVTEFRRTHAPETRRHSFGKRGLNIDWKGLDWSERSKDLAAKLGVGLSLVCIQRRKHAPETRWRKQKK